MRTILLMASASKSFFQQGTCQRLLEVLAFLWLCVPFASAQLMAPQAGPPSTQLPPFLRGIRLEQRLGDQIPLDLEFRNEEGRPVRLRNYFGSKPVILALVYYQCPMLCTQVLNGLAGSLAVISFDVGNQFDVLTMSFDPHDTPRLAAAKKENYVRRYRRAGASGGWHFLTGDEASIQALTGAVGFHYAFDPRSRQFAHPSGIIVLTPEGRIARYFYGIEYAPRDLRLGLVEASKNKIGSPADQILLFCYHYDPSTGKYSVVILRILKLAAALTLLALLSLFLVLQNGSRGKRCAREVA